MFDYRTQYTIGLTSQSGKILNPDDVVNHVANVLAAHGIDGFCVHHVAGYWKGAREDALRVEVCTEFADVEKSRVIAGTLAIMADQECVLYSVQPIVADLVFPAGPNGE